MEYKLLGYNLNFIPTPDKINKKEILDNVNNFNRRVKLKSHFGDTPPKEGLYFKSNSSWEPPNPHYTVKTFTENFKNNMIKSLDKKDNNDNKNKQRNNLNKHEQEALEALKKT